MHYYMSYLILLCSALAFSQALSLPQATPSPQKRDVANSTIQGNTLSNTTANGGQFAIKLDAGGGTITMDVGPLSVFTQTTTSLQTPSGTGYVIYPTDYSQLSSIPSDGIYVVFGETTQQDLLTQFNKACGTEKLSDPACIEGLGEVLDEQAPDLQKRFLPLIPVFAVVLAVDALVLAILGEQMYNSGPDYKPVGVLHYESSVLVSLQDVSTAISASVILVETTTGDPHAITISTTELASFNPSPTTSAASNGTGVLTGTGLLVTGSSGQFVLQIQSTDMPALQNASSLMASPAPTCTGSPITERDDTDSYEEAFCLASELMNNADGLSNPNGLMNTFRTQILEVVNQLPPADFVPIFQDLAVVGAFALFLNVAGTVMPNIFPGLQQQGWLVAGFLAFTITNLPLASNTQGKLQTQIGVTQIVLQVTKGQEGSQSICAPTEQPYDCANVLCAGNANNVCTGQWLENCPCVTCPSTQDMPSCDVCNTANPTSGICATVNPGCSCYIDTMQNSNLQDLAFNTLALQVWSSLGSWASTDGTTTPWPYNEGVTCRPDNFWYGGCGGYPNTQTGSAYGASLEFESCLTSFFSPGSAQNFNSNQKPNPTLPTGQMLGAGLPNVTMICATNKATVDLIINVAYAPGCLSETSNGLLNISDPIGDGSINGADVLRGTYYGCLNFDAFYDPSTNSVDMVAGSAAQAYNPSSLPNSNLLYSGVSNQGLGGWNQVGCLIYEVINSKNRPKIAVNNGSSNIWEQAMYWDQYQTNWPTLAETYYDLGGWYCPPSINLQGAPVPPCEAFPCPLGFSASTSSAIQNFFKT